MAHVYEPKDPKILKHQFEIGQSVRVKGSRIFQSRHNDSAFSWTEGKVEKLVWSKKYRVLCYDDSDPAGFVGKTGLIEKYIQYPMLIVNGKAIDQRNVRKA